MTVICPAEVETISAGPFVRSTVALKMSGVGMPEMFIDEMFVSPEPSPVKKAASMPPVVM